MPHGIIFTTFAVMKLPEQFVEQLRQLPGIEGDALLEAITGSEPVVSVRVKSECASRIPPQARHVPWCDEGFYLDVRQPFSFDTDFHAGAYYVQDASSMFIGHVIRSLIHNPVRYLDLCAAPGGKTTAALQALPVGSLVVANEVVPQRARVLADNVMRWGSDQCVVTSNKVGDFARLMPQGFDVVAADVPCSGEGMMRKDAEAVAQWSPQLVQRCAQRQLEIVNDIWPALRPGGLFIYSTCTYNCAENEGMIRYIIDELDAQPVSVPVSDEWGITPALGVDFPAYRFLSHRTQGEGLFLAVLRKAGDTRRHDVRGKTKSAKATVNLPQNWLERPDDFVLHSRGNEVIALPTVHAQTMLGMLDSLQVLQAGTPVATVMGKKMSPHHALALSRACNHAAFPHVELDYASALRYLRGESIVIDAPAGYAIVTHNNAALGFVNNLGNRANNLYPKSLRILSTHLPTAKPVVLLP